LTKNGKLKKASWNSKKIQDDTVDLTINYSQSPPKKRLLDNEEQKNGDGKSPMN
jgi:hypothetical protein